MIEDTLLDSASGGVRKLKTRQSFISASQRGKISAKGYQNDVL